MSQVSLNFPVPGRYEFRLRVSDGTLVGGRFEDNDEAVAVIDVPGMTGKVYALPTDGVLPVSDVQVAVYPSLEAAEQGLLNAASPPATLASGQFAEVFLWWEVTHPLFGTRYFETPYTVNDVPDVITQEFWDEWGQYISAGHWEVHVSVWTDAAHTIPAADWSPNEMNGLWYVGPGLHAWQILDSGGNGLWIDGGINNAPGHGVWWIIQSPSNTLQRRLLGTTLTDVAVTDSEGNYTLENVGFADGLSGIAELVVSWSKSPEYLGSNTERIFLNPTNMERDLGIARASLSTLEGRVVDRSTGSALNEVSFSIVAGVNVMASDTTDVQGQFSVNEVRMGAWMMQLWKPGYRSELRSIQVHEGMDAIDVSMVADARSATLEGQVLLAETGEPVSGARVSLGTGAIANTDLGGYYRFVDLPIGRYIAYIERDGLETLRAVDVVLEPEANTKDFELDYEDEGPSVSGQVVWSDDTPAAGVRVGLVDADLYQANGPYVFVRSATTDAAGYYRLLDCPRAEQILSGGRVYREWGRCRADDFGRHGRRGHPIDEFCR